MDTVFSPIIDKVAIDSTDFVQRYGTINTELDAGKTYHVLSQRSDQIYDLVQLVLVDWSNAGDPIFDFSSLDKDNGEAVYQVTAALTPTADGRLEVNYDGSVEAMLAQVVLGNHAVTLLELDSFAAQQELADYGIITRVG